jgi:Cell wall binding domain 2 (CWB2)
MRLQPRPRRGVRKRRSRSLAAGAAAAGLAIATLATPGVLSAAAGPFAPAHIVRIAGPDRYATSVAISKATWQAGAAKAVVLARGDTFPDALAGGPLAAMKDAPLLLTRPAGLLSTIKAEIQRVLPAGETVYLLGGTSAISPQIQSQLQSLGYLTKRLGGATRYATAALIAREIKPTTRNIWLATGRNFPDALAAGAAAAHFTVEQGFQPHVLLLTNDATLPAETAGYIADSRPGFTDMIINTAGSRADQAAKNAYGGDDFFDIRSNVGADRYETSTKIVKQYYPTGPGGDVGLATGENFADALGAAAMLARQPFEPLLLTKPTALPAVVADYLEQIDPGPWTLHVFGGASAVSGSVATAAANRMGDFPDLPDRSLPTNGQPVTLTFAADQEGALTFTAPESGHPRLTFTNSTLGACRLSMRVFQPSGDVLAGDECVGTGSKYILDGLTAGDITWIFLDPYGSATGSVTVTLEIVQDLPDQPITPDGPPVTLQFEPGQNGALTRWPAPSCDCVWWIGLSTRAT